MVSLQNMTGRRYASLEDVKKDMEILTGKSVRNIIFSELEPKENDSECMTLDNMIDYELEGDEVRTLYYLKDNAGKIFITEV